MPGAPERLFSNQTICLTSACTVWVMHARRSNCRECVFTNAIGSLAVSLRVVPTCLTGWRFLS